MSTHVIYIPGLGDGYYRLRTAALSLWKLWGTPATLAPIRWFDGKGMEQQLDIVRDAIDAVPPKSRIVLVGESAGATLALHMATRDARVSRVITLCGVASPATPISKSLRQKAPALDQAVSTLPERFDIDVHSVRAAVDNVVGARYSSAAGAKRHVIWSIGHIMTISLCLTLLAPIMSGIAKVR